MQEWLNRPQDIDWNFVQVSALGFLIGWLIALVISIASHQYCTCHQYYNKSHFNKTIWASHHI
jgi:hypothetical protein